MKHIIATALMSLALAGCVYQKPSSNPPGPVHPTDEQINNAGPGETTQDPPYTPWWAENEPR